ncbi:YvrJ family protein [Bacillus piscicola]|uniref:YvrJ family protein n=1 Tax=Bacillus piscicola TaxID=1632684 RepID=UPI001F090DC4|nr:YvrJ family protein [Bacillus piscicola]
MEELIALISNVGFPIAVASYLLIRLEPVVKDLQASISSLAVMIGKQNEATVQQVGELLEVIQYNEKSK